MFWNAVSAVARGRVRRLAQAIEVRRASASFWFRSTETRIRGRMNVFGSILTASENWSRAASFCPAFNNV